jgi:hypothetical protein
MFAVVYEQTDIINDATGWNPGIYTDFFAMKYWRNSFGFNAVWAGLGLFVVGHVIIFIIDRRL